MKPEKPKFPNPRLIREDFLPYEPMKNYIKGQAQLFLYNRFEK